MRAISEDLRERAVAAVVGEGWSRERAGQVYGISAVSVGRYVSAYQAGESLTPRQGGGRPRKLRLAEHVETLREHLEAEPDLDLSARCEHLARTEGVHLSVSTLWRALRALGWTRKKDAERQRAGPGRAGGVALAGDAAFTARRFGVRRRERRQPRALPA